MRAILAMRADTVLSGSLAEWSGIFGIGLLFDLVTAGYLLAPFVAWLALAPDPIARTRPYRALALAGFFVLVYGFVVLAVAEWLFWDEFGGRFNFIAVDYLLYTHEVIGNIWQSYPVGWILAALLLPVGMLTWLLGRRLWRASGAPFDWRMAIAAFAVHALLVAGTLRYVDSDLKNIFRRTRRTNWRERRIRVLRRELPQRAQLRPALRDTAAGTGDASVRAALQGAPGEWIEAAAQGMERARRRGAAGAGASMWCWSASRAWAPSSSARTAIRARSRPTSIDWLVTACGSPGFTPPATAPCGDWKRCHSRCRRPPGSRSCAAPTTTRCSRSAACSKTRATARCSPMAVTVTSTT